MRRRFDAHPGCAKLRHRLRLRCVAAGADLDRVRHHKAFGVDHDPRFPWNPLPLSNFLPPRDAREPLGQHGDGRPLVVRS